MNEPAGRGKDSSAFIAACGFLAGYSCLPNMWWHFGWLLLSGIWAVWKSQELNWHSYWPAWLFIGWMTLRSSFSTDNNLAAGCLGVGMLVLWLLIIALVTKAGRWQSCARIFGHVSAVAALVSIVWAIVANPYYWAEGRLSNVLVHGGLNAVCTGLIFGFAALWLCVINDKNRFVLASASLLHAAVFLSGTRGAMLALAGGHVALMLASGWTRAWRGVAMFVITALLYFGGMPSVIRIQREARAEIAHVQTDPAEIAKASSVLQNAIARGEGGRLPIYKAGWQTLWQNHRIWCGIGQWSDQDEWQRLLPNDPHGLMRHLHSAFFATLVHGGILGAALLLVLLIIVTRSAWHEVRAQRPEWPVLLTFGCLALIFDGESLAYLNTQPRFEALLFWLPVAALLCHSKSDGVVT